MFPCLYVSVFLNIDWFSFSTLGIRYIPTKVTENCKTLVSVTITLLCCTRVWCLRLTVAGAKAKLKLKVDETQVWLSSHHPKLAVIISCHTNKTIYVLSCTKVALEPASSSSSLCLSQAAPSLKPIWNGKPLEPHEAAETAKATTWCTYVRK